MKLAKTQHTFTVPMSWHDMLWGNYFHSTLTMQLQSFLKKLYGLHMLKIGNLSAEINTCYCTIDHQVNVGNEGDKLQVIASEAKLPFASKSIDVCLLAHTLVWSKDPYLVLHEVDRVLIDDGWIIISSFNPFSLLGMSKIVVGLQQSPPWNGRMFSQVRLLNWLSLLNYEVIYRTCCQIIPWQRQSVRLSSLNISLMLGCINIVIARKRTVPLTLNKIKKFTKYKAFMFNY